VISEKTHASRSALWSVLENGGLALVSFGSLILYSRYLSASDFGVFSVVLALTELLGVLVAMLFHDALVQKRQLAEIDFDTAFTATLALALVLFAGCVLFAPLYARLSGTEAAGRVLAWTALCLPCSAMSATIVARQRRDLEFRALALRSLGGRLGGAAIGITMVVLGLSYWGLVAQQLVTAAVGSLVLWVCSNKRPRLRFSSKSFRELIRFGGYAVGALFLSFSVKRVFVVGAGVALGSEAAGVLNMSFRTVDVLWGIAFTAVTQVALPVLSRMQADPLRFQRAYKSAVEFVCLALFPCFIGIAVTAPETVAVLFGDQWLASVPYVTCLSLLPLLQCLTMLITPSLTALGRPRDPIIAVAAELVVLLVLMSVLGARTLPYAVAIWMVRELVAAPIMVALLQRVGGIRWTAQLAAIRTPALAVAAMALAVVLARPQLSGVASPVLRLVILAPLGAVTYGAMLWTFDRRVFTRVLDFVVSARGKTPDRDAPAVRPNASSSGPPSPGYEIK
jgi:O-antigen/teichoic acid export membrane protein